MVPYQRVFEELQKRDIRYLVAGGFAVNFHQVQRATVDLDLVIQIERENILKFVSLMADLGFKPRLPVQPKDFADEVKRQKWISSKGMMVFTFVHSKNVFEIIDIFSQEPRPFEEMWADRKEIHAFGVKISVVSKQHLIEMKKKANREKDKFDIEQLKKS